MGIVYKATSPVGKSYIGITSKTIEFRRRQHKYNAAKGRKSSRGDDCLCFYNAIRKYGFHAFTWEVLYENDEWSILCNAEKDFIAQFNTLSPGGYNLSLGGDGTPGVKLSDEARLRISKARKEKAADPQIRARLLASLSAAVRIRAEKWHAKSESEKAEWCRLHGAKVKAGHSTPESIAKTTAANRKKGADPVIRARMSAGQRGKKKAPWTEERKRKASEQKKTEWANPQLREKRMLAFALAQTTRRISREKQAEVPNQTA